MRLQLTLSLALLLGATQAHADGQVVAWVSVYSDDDQLTVISPQVSAQHQVVEQLDVAAGYEADIISAATVDVRTAASPRGYDEVRHGGRVAVTWLPQPETTLGLSYIPSAEPDYASHAIGASTSHAWLDRRLTTSVSAFVRLNQVGRADEPYETWRSLTTSILALEQGVVLDRYTVASVAYELQLSRGFTASPYRFAEIFWSDGTQLLVPENNPDTRTRHAGGIDLRRALTRQLFLSGGYRFYGDDWGVTSHTGDAKLQYGFWRERLIASAAVRAYYQSAADFYRERNEAATGFIPKLRSADKSLAAGWSLLGDLQLELNFESLGFLQALRVALGLGFYDQHFIDFTRLEGRRAVLASLGLTAEY